jgi:hypothetical protein
MTDSTKTKKVTKNPTPSPLMRSAFEVLEHGLWHFFRSDTSADMKFALLHVDQSIELFYKERIRIGGISIYKNPKETINIWAAYSILDEKIKCSIPERPDLELLHEERNNIQHKYSNPSADDAAFHIENAIKFLKRFLMDELNTKIEEFIPNEYLEQLL